jgi:hypothetical protein
MDLIELLRPITSSRVYDTVAQAGISVEAWHNVSSKITPAQNPAFCYRWAFEGNGKILLFLWYSELAFRDDGAEYFGNARKARNLWEERANDQRDPSTKRRLRTWSDSAQLMDEVLKICAREDREVRVALVHTKADTVSEDARSSADYRMLDAEPWHLVHYEMQDGSFHLRRGIRSVYEEFQIVNPLETAVDPQPEITSDGYGIGVSDQFVGTDNPVQHAVNALVWERSALVRQKVLARSGGRCEYCLEQGFRKANGDVYLETHHVLALSEGGSDTLSNVIALCPGHHREAHYGARKLELVVIFQSILAGSASHRNAPQTS